MHVAQDIQMTWREIVFRLTYPAAIHMIVINQLNYRFGPCPVVSI